MTQLIFRAIGLAVLLSGTVYAQWMPITGKIRQTREITGAKGELLEKKITRAGSYYRSSNGSTLRQWTEIGGTPTKNVTAELVDNRSGATYLLQYLEKRATVKFQGEPLSPDMYSSQQLKSIGQDVVAGVNCSIVPAKEANSGRDVGRFCIAPEYGLALRVESFGKRADGSTVRVITELYDLQLGSEPDPKLFDLSQFSVVKLTPVNQAR